jgi:hypothetical protein
METATGSRIAVDGTSFLAAARFEGAEVDRAEVERIASQAQRPTAEPDRKKDNQAQRLLNKLLSGGAQFFNGSNQRPYIILNETISDFTTERGFLPVLRWLRSIGEVPFGNAKSNLVDLMNAEAFARPPEEVSFRVGSCSGNTGRKLYVNLMNDRGQLVEIDSSGWQVRPAASSLIRMINREAALALPEPRRSQPSTKPLAWIDRHLNIPPISAPHDPNDEGVQARAAILAFISAQFFREGAVPHLLITGPQGSGKTSVAKRLKSLTDPDRVEVMSSLPSDDASVYAMAAEQTSIVLDNASKTGGDQSDLLCSLASGTGHAARRLYTNSGRSVMTAKLSVITTTIREDLFQRPDLRDRTLVLQLAPFPTGGRRREADLDAAWLSDTPAILAEIFDFLSAGMQHEAAVSADLAGMPVPRLADVAHFAECVARAAGWPPLLCVEALIAMRATSEESHLAEDGLALRIRGLLQQKGRWTGTMLQLHQALSDMRAPSLPAMEVNTARGLRAALDRLEAPLLELWGIKVTKQKKAAAGKMVELSCKHVAAVGRPKQ